MRNRTPKIIYIAGNGHSGSTLLDIILSSDDRCFSGGELTNITRETLPGEYCACGALIPQCETWRRVFSQWVPAMGFSLTEYKKMRNKYERNKASFRTLKNKFLPSTEFRRYCDATGKLFSAISEVTGKEIIVDSSKSPQRIAVLKKIADVQVLHICRDFSGVLNSGKNVSQKTLKLALRLR